MDRDQFGGIAQNSVAHYLIEITNFILHNQDMATPMATIMTLVDFSKGFNRIHHGILIEELIHLGVPGWIVRIVVSYLSERKLRIRYKEGVSEPADLPGGVGQGTIMGMWLFLIKMNNFGKQSTPGNGPRRPLCYTKIKWVDDLTEVNSIY